MSDIEIGENGAVRNVKIDEPGIQPIRSEHAYADGPRSVDGLFGWARIFLCGYVAAEVASFLLLSAYMMIPDQVPNIFYPDTPDGLHAGYSVDLFYIVMALIAFFFVGRFTYRANKNLHTAGRKRPDMSPGWTVGFYFIPIMNLFKPAMGMHEIYADSLEATGVKVNPPTLISWWWAAWLVMGVPERFATALIEAGTKGLPVKILYGISAALGISAAVILIKICKRITEAQSALQNGGLASVFD